LAPSPHADADTPSPLYLRALKTSFEGRIDEAIVLCRQVIDLNPSEEIFYLLNRCYQKKGQLGKALEALHQAVRIADDQVSYKTYFQLGTLYHRTGQFDQAVIAYRHSIHLHSREEIKLYKKNDIEGAIQAYQKALEVATDQSEMP